ncbi:MAG: PD-(D/E)XK nuclease family protein [Bacteroidota bacterium]
MNQFNYFTILSKDDKELIHSSFLWFLLTDELTSEFVLPKLFPVFTTSLNRASVNLEKVYTYQVPGENGKRKSKRIRLDIEAKSVDGQTILLIENKFKSFPHEEQLNFYDERFRENYSDKTIVKYLLCFDKTIIPFSNRRTDWNYISYTDVLEVVQALVTTVELEEDKKTFIRHYIDFLQPFLVDYEKIKLDCGYLFFDGKNEANKFWIRHINAIARLKLDKYFFEKGVPVNFTVNPGNTSVPLINISPLHWNNHLIAPDLCIQVQNHNLKYYYGAKGNLEFNRLLDITKGTIAKSDGKFNKPNANRGETNFVYLERLDQTTRHSSFSVDDFVNRIIAFFEKMDEAASIRFN